MDAILEAFNERVAEIDLYFKMLTALEEPQAQLYFPNRKRNKYQQPHKDWLKTLKATAFLLIYNLVESSIRDGIGEIYENAKADKCTVEQLEESLRRIWINQAFRDLKAVESFQQRSTELVNQVLDRVIVDLNKDKFPISGNLDAKEIRRLCDRHGLTFSESRIANQGWRLALVKDKRNSLAHGSESFAECGRSFTVDDFGSEKGTSTY